MSALPRMKTTMVAPEAAMMKGATRKADRERRDHWRTAQRRTTVDPTR
jgi:hypothetical protein